MSEIQLLYSRYKKKRKFRTRITQISKKRNKKKMRKKKANKMKMMKIKVNSKRKNHISTLILYRFKLFTNWFRLAKHLYCMEKTDYQLLEFNWK